jgi:hypothetical protein
MTKPNDGAYPWQQFNQSIANSDGEGQGLTKREYFIITLLAAMHASTPGSVGESCVSFAIKEADELIKELNKQTDTSAVSQEPKK